MQDSIMQQFLRSSSYNGANAAYIEDLYEVYLHDANSVPEQWRTFFDSLPRVESGPATDFSHETVRNHFELLGRKRARPAPAPGSGGVNVEHERKQVRVQNLISAYRNRGHQKAKLDPLGLWQREATPDLELQFHGFTASDLDTTFQASTLYFGKQETTLKDIVDSLEAT